MLVLVKNYADSTAARRLYALRTSRYRIVLLSYYVSYIAFGFIACCLLLAAFSTEEDFARFITLSLLPLFALFGFLHYKQFHRGIQKLKADKRSERQDKFTSSPRR